MNEKQAKLVTKQEAIFHISMCKKKLDEMRMMVENKFSFDENANDFLFEDFIIEMENLDNWMDILKELI